MKASAPRRYTMRARAQAAEATGERILDAAIELFAETSYEDVSLDAIAVRSAVTTRTVIRRFGSKESLFVAAMNRARDIMVAQRDEAPVGDIANAVRNVISQYERWGDNRLRLIAQEDKIEVIADHVRGGRRYHRDWVARVFAPLLSCHAGQARERRLIGLIVLTDVFTWKLLRRDLGLGRVQTERTIVELIETIGGENV